MLLILENLDNKFMVVPSECCETEISSQLSESFVTISIIVFILINSNFFFDITELLKFSI